MTNIKQICAQLIELWDADCDINMEINELRAVLVKPKPEGPTDEELEEWADACSEAPLEELNPEVHGWRRCFTAQEFSETIRAALARWGRPTPQPIPVTERPWEREGWCDKQGRCWWFTPEDPCWVFDDATTCRHWADFVLPADAIPTPRSENV